MIKIEKPLIEVSWLQGHLQTENLVILNATLPKAVAGDVNKEQNERIPGARFFDIKNVFSDTSAPYPNTWPGQEAFNQEARGLGISKNSAIVVYDEHGIYSSARAWWMFRSMGHDNVAVLNGGLKAWEEAGLALEPKSDQAYEMGDFKGMYKEGFFKNHLDVLQTLKDDNQLVIDARAENRYKGLVEEPREGLRSGHIPRSVSLPYTDLLTDGRMLDGKELKRLFVSTVTKNKNLTFSCGSGITACVLALGAELAGYNHLSVYDGSWTEWGSMHELPIEK